MIKNQPSKIKEKFSKAVKSLGLGFSGSQFDYLWSFIDSELKAQKEETLKEIEKDWALKQPSKALIEHDNLAKYIRELKKRG